MLTPNEIEEYFAQVGVKISAVRGPWRDAPCPWHEDRTRSFVFNVNSGGWKCHAGCGFGGLKEAAAKSGVPFPKSANGNGQPADETLYSYFTADKKLAYQVVRLQKGTKKTFRQRRPDGHGTWVWNMTGVAPLPYRLPELLAAPAETAFVFVCEGEKDVENLRDLGLPATTNHGGAGKWKKEHAQYLKGRRVVVLPDNDEPGRKHAGVVAMSLQKLASEVRVLTLPDLPAKGDVSDWLAAGGTKEGLLALAAAAPVFDAAVAQLYAAAPDAKEPGVPSAAPAAPGVEVRALGYADGTYYYLSPQTRQIAALTAQGHQKLPLLALAPASYWNRHYAADDGPVAWTAAAADLMLQCSRRGVFDPSRIRGRGAWYDAGRPVVHLGDGLVVDGVPCGLNAAPTSAYVYPAAVPLHLDFANPLAAAESARLSALCDTLNWDKPLHGRLLAGWLAVAPVCGALAWRPHVWITGAAGSGKSWIMDNIMRPLLGKIGLFVQGDTTEAGIRQALNYDARPVLFDEAEGESERAQLRMQNVMALMRQSSSENGSVIVKGTTSGAVKIYCIRSCFAFSSIGVGIRQHADSTRVSVLSLSKNEDPKAAERFASIKKETGALLTKEYIGAMHARMISLIPIIRANAEIFAEAVASAVGSQRMGDQTGILLAGAYALHSDKIIDDDEAWGWVGKQDWAEQNAIQESPDEILCLQHLLQYVMKIPAYDGRPEERNVSELIELAESGLDPHGNSYRQALLRQGIRVDADTIVIASNHSGIKHVMAKTPWHDWGRVLRRIPGAAPTPNPVRFGKIIARGTVIPKTAISN